MDTGNKELHDKMDKNRNFTLAFISVGVAISSFMIALVVNAVS